MTDKRFHYHIDEVGIYYYICDGGKTEDKIFAEVIGDVEEITDKLNELNEENEQLKEENQKLAQELQETEGLIVVLKEMVLENGNERTS